MSTSAMLPLFFILSLDDKDGNKRQQLVESLIPSMVPGPPTQRMALSAVVADGQIDTQRRREETIAGEVTSAISKASGNADKKLSDADVAGLPTLSPVIARVPALRQQVDAVAVAADQHEKAAVLLALEQQGAAVLNDFFHAIQQIAGNSFKKLAEAQLDAFPTLKPILNRDSTIKAVFVGDPNTVIAIPPASARTPGGPRGTGTPETGIASAESGADAASSARRQPRG